jgi:calcium/calmodulin-dependent protein kinase I
VVADFGLSKVFARGELLQTHCGTPNYAAPEVLRGDPSYNEACDMWSIGVITYVILSGRFPFFEENQVALARKIIEGSFSFPPDVWSNVSDTAKDFIQKLLIVNPADRMTAQQGLPCCLVSCLIFPPPPMVADPRSSPNQRLRIRGSRTLLR